MRYLMIRPAIILFLFFICTSVGAEAQKLRRVQRYGEINSIVEKIKGVYIPKNMKEAMKALDTSFKQEDREYLKNNNWEEVDLHFSTGMWIRNMWLWNNSRFYLYLRENGMGYEPDGMSGRVLSYYRKHLKGEKFDDPANGRPRRVVSSAGGGLVYHFFEIQGRRGGMKRQKSGYEVGDSVRFSYPFGYTSAQEEKLYNYNGGRMPQCEGVVTAVVNDNIRVRVENAWSEHGLLVYNGNVAQGSGRKYVRANYRRLERRDASMYFMKVGEEMWFPVSLKIWEK